MSTHYLDEAERCSRVALLHAGRVLACDEPSRLRAAMPDTASLEDVFVAHRITKDSM